MLKKITMVIVAILSFTSNACITTQEIENSNTLYSYQNKVYDITGYSHPGGKSTLKKAVGIDIEDMIKKSYKFHLKSKDFQKDLDDTYKDDLCIPLTTIPTTTLTTIPTTTIPTTTLRTILTNPTSQIFHTNQTTSSTNQTTVRPTNQTTTSIIQFTEPTTTLKSTVNSVSTNYVVYINLIVIGMCIFLNR